MNNEHFWTEKRKQIKNAAQHIELINNKNRAEIVKGIARTEAYTGSVPVTYPESIHIPAIFVDSYDSVTSMLEHQEQGEKMAVLNFANYKTPGGTYLTKGTRAQEESLMYSSGTLYSVLKQFDDSFYAYNRQNMNRGLFRNRGLYTPDMIFYDRETLVNQDITDANTVKADVITVSAPNASTALRYGKVSPLENESALDSRIRFLLDIAESNQVKILILGAFGSGVFGQDAAVVAKIFKKYLTSGNYSFDKVYFSVPDIEDGMNYKKMKQVFENC